MKVLFLSCCLLMGMGGYSAYAQTAKPPGAKLREGTHNLTLQWVGWDNPGKVKITRQTDSTYTIKGEQRDDANDGFVTIDGTLKVASPQELIFDGTIQTQSKTINQGKVCNKTGTYHFLAKGARKYWRLQEMDNCEGNRVVDYVDIYF